MTTTALEPGTAVRVTEPCGGDVYVAPRIGQTRMQVRVSSGSVVGPVPFEPGMTRVRIDGVVRRVLSEYLEPVPVVCRACVLWEWDGTGSLPFNPDAGPCAHCGGDHAELFGGCCRDCFRLGYREACSRANCRR